MDSAIRRINHYPLDNWIGFASAYRLNSDLSDGYRYPSFEQLEPGLQLTYICSRFYKNEQPPFFVIYNGSSWNNC